MKFIYAGVTLQHKKNINMTEKRTIGELIEKEVRRQQLSIVEFADKICCKRNNVYNLFTRNNP